MSRISAKFGIFAVGLFSMLLLIANVFAQETTGGLQGTVKDPSGAVVAKAKVDLTGTSLVGTKSLETDSSGYYRFANLPPGVYTVSVKAAGFSELKREGITIEVGHLPSLDLTLTVGAAGTVVEVSGAAPVIDVTTETTQTNITSDVVQDVPHGRSFQSVIQFAPSASNEPLMGSNRASNGTGAVSPGNGSNGSAYGYSVAGGSDSENLYLVEGQSTANIIGGYSHTNVPFDFIQEVQVKSEGIEAEHGGALGGVVNVVMRKGQNNYHGSVFAQFENQALDGTPAVYQRYDPLSSLSGFTDATNQQAQPIKPHTSDFFPGFTFGGPILKDKIFFFLGFNPEWNDFERTVNYGPTNGGYTPFSRNTQTYYTSARIDYAVTRKIRVFGSWLYQYQRQAGENLPASDTVGGLFNASTGCFGSATSASNPCVSSGVPQSSYAHSLGYTAPNITTNFGADWTITPRLISTSRFGYYFENYRDFGFPTSGNLYAWQNNSIYVPANGCVLAGVQQPGCDTTETPLPAALQHSTGYINGAIDANMTTRNANKAVQFDEDFAWFKSGWHGTHNFKFGYQLNRLSNNILQGFNQPYTQIYAGYNGTNTYYLPATPTGTTNCGPYIQADGLCQGQFGVATVYDFGTGGKATSFNHGFFAQDAWTIGRGVTLSLGLRVEREYLPGEGLSGPGVPSQPINFSWGDKIAPRIGAAWDVFKDGRMKVFGSYGVYNDIMKLNVAISSFGGQYWQNCAYAWNVGSLATVTPAFNSAGRDCVGAAATSEANFAPGGGGWP